MKPGVTSPPRPPSSAENGSPRMAAVSIPAPNVGQSAGADHMPAGVRRERGAFAAADSATRAVSTSIASIAEPDDPFATPTIPESQYPPTTVLNEQRLSGTSPP